MSDLKERLDNLKMEIQKPEFLEGKGLRLILEYSVMIRQKKWLLGISWVRLWWISR